VRLEFKEYRPRKIVNVHQHVDGPWFWEKYSAHPYVGCRSGCEFCYLRGERYLRNRDPNTFDTLIQVKTNAPELLAKELARLEPDVIACGDWQQPAEDRYRISRHMLEVVHEARFPLFIVERSPLLTRDIDLLTEIDRQTWVGVTISISNLDPDLKQAFEPRSPGVKRRLEMMARLAEAGILVGTALMPIMPVIGDGEAQLEATIQATVDHGGQFVLAGGLSMDGAQADRTLEAARSMNSASEGEWRALYSWETSERPAYGPPRDYVSRLGRTVRKLTARHGLSDRMARYIPPGPQGINKRIAERLFLKTYDLELELADTRRIWAYRKAAWTVDEMPENIADLYASRGESGLRELPGVGARLAGLIASWLRQMANER
jgi:DNA repair photolyase